MTGRVRAMRNVAQAAVPLLAVLMTGCGRMADGETLDVRSRESQQAIGLTLPPKAKVTFVHRMRGIDDAAQIIAVMPIADWQALEHRLTTTIPHAAPPTYEDASRLGADHDAWTPGQQPHLTARQVPWRGGVEWMTIGSGPAGPGMVRVFIFWNQT